MVRWGARIRRDSASRVSSVSAWSFVQAVGAAIAKFAPRAVRLRQCECPRICSVRTGRIKWCLHEQSGTHGAGPKVYGLLVELTHGPSLPPCSAQQPHVFNSQWRSRASLIEHRPMSPEFDSNCTSSRGLQGHGETDKLTFKS